MVLYLIGLTRILDIGLLQIHNIQLLVDLWEVATYMHQQKAMLVMVMLVLLPDTK
jgi:hypothetical protein